MNFDLHFHPTTKSFVIGNTSGSRGSCWDQICAGKVIPIDEWEDVTDDRLDSQSSLVQLYKGDVKVGIASLHAIEPDYLKPMKLKLVTLITDLNNKLVKRIKKRKYTSYAYINDEMDHLIKASLETRGNKSMGFIKEEADLRKDQIGLMVSIEGGHCFLEKEVPDRIDYEDEQLSNVIVNRFEVFIDKYKDIVCFTYLTLTHIARGPLCTQAFAFAKKRVKPVANGKTHLFFPKGPIGIRKVGHKIIESALKRNILIDIKHTSYYSRLKYYEKLKLEYADKEIPIIASHMGAAGYSFGEMRKNWKSYSRINDAKHVKVSRKFGIKGTRFYPLSLNLFDEEIQLIVQSKGLIGISLDERICGIKYAWYKKRRKYEADYVHHEEFDFLVSDAYNNLEDQLFEKQRDVAFPISLIIAKQSRTKKHLLYLCNNILRFVYAGGDTTWKHICIGSDFDGMIDALDNCKTSAEMKNLKEDLKEELFNILNTIENADNLFFVDSANLREDINSKVDDLMFNNGVDFIKKHFLQ